MFDLTTIQPTEHREGNKFILSLSFQDFIDDLEGAVEVAKFRAVNRHEFVPAIGLVNLDSGVHRNVFPQAEDWIDACEIPLVVSLAVSG